MIAAGGAMFEFSNQAHQVMPYRLQAAEMMLDSGVVVHFTARYNTDQKELAVGDFDPGLYGSRAERRLVFEYATYFMLVRPTQMDQLYLDLFLNYSNPRTYERPRSYPATASTGMWLGLFEHPIGAAHGPRRRLASGTDPSGQRYDVSIREFDHVVVVWRPVPDWTATKYGTAK
jgi:hypothetical protein